jgi:glycosyltransferase involved in cell wall biosynthesis
MALAKPVVVTRTAAIAAGYGLVDGENVRLAMPGDADAFGLALADVRMDEHRARALGTRARDIALSDLGWDRYVDALERSLRGAL